MVIVTTEIFVTPIKNVIITKHSLTQALTPLGRQLGCGALVVDSDIFEI